MAMRRQSGRAYGQGGKNRGPKRNPRKPTEARARPPAYRLPASEPRGDAPQTRKQDFQRANAYKKTSVYQRHLQAARQSGQRQYEANMRERAPKEAAQQRKELQARRDRNRPSIFERALKAAASAGESVANVLTTPTAAEQIQDRADTSPTRGVRRQVTKELEGKGELAKGLGKLAPILSSPGSPGEKVMASGFSGRAPGTRLLRATKAAGEDAVNLPATVLPSLYVPADAAVKAAKGDTKAAKQLVRDLKNSSVLYNAATGHFADAARLAEEHPGFTAAEVLGAKGALGRGAGRGVRATGRVVTTAGRKTGSRRLVRAGEKVRRVAATDTRPDAVVPGTPLREVRTYSRDLTNKPLQIAKDKIQAGRAQKLRRQAERIEAAVDENLTPGERAREMAQGGQEEAARLRRRAAEVDPTIMSEREIQRRIDLQEARAGTKQRNAKAEREAQARKIVRSSGDKGAALNLVAQGITRASVEDLRAYRDELAAAAEHLGPAKRQANRELRQKINTSLERAANGRFRRTDLEKVAQAARDYHEQIDAPLDARLVELGLLDREEAARTKLISFASREMGAAPRDRAPLRDTARDARRAERRAERAARGAKRRHTAAERREARQLGRAELLVRRASDAEGDAPSVDTARAALRTAEAASRRAERQRVSQTGRAARQQGRAEVIVSRSAPVRSRKVRPGDATAPRRTLAKLEREQAHVMVAEAQLKSARKAEKAAKSTLEQARRQSRKRRDAATARRALDVLERKAADVLAASEDVRRAEARVVAARAAREAAERDAKRTGLAGPDNAPLDYEQVTRRIGEERDAPPSYVSQAPNARRPGAYYETTSREPVTQGRRRTGQAVREGTLDADREMLVQSAVKRENLANAASSYREGISEIAVRDPETGKARPVAYEDADRLAQDMTAETGTEFVPVSFEPWRASQQQREAMRDALEDLDEPQAFEALTASILEGLSGKQREGRFLVVPKAAASRMRQHLDVLQPGDLNRVMRQVRRNFSTTVLSTSPSYPIGNLAEAGFRTAVNRAGPRSALTTKRVLRRMRELDPQKAEALVNSVLTGGKFTLATRKRHLDPRSLENSPTMRKAVAGLQAAMKAPVAAQLGALWRGWTTVVNELANGKVERGAQYAMLGKAMRDMGLTEEFFKLSSKAIDDMARGLLDTAEQHRAAELVIDAFGNYGARFSPAKRKLIAEYTPFLAWMASSSNFLFRVLPRDHPLAMALLVVNQRATEDWREAVGLDDLPDYLMGGLTNRRNGRLWAVSRNTPFGAFTGNVAENLGDLFLPQVLPALDAMRTGRDWRGYRLPDDSSFGRAAYALEEMAKSSIPAVAVATKGRTYWQDPEKALSAIERPPYKPKSGKKLVKKRRPGDLPPLPDLPDLDLDLGGGLDLGDSGLGG